MKAAARAMRAIFADGFLPGALEVADEFLRWKRRHDERAVSGWWFARVADGGIGWSGEIGAQRLPRPLERLLRTQSPVFVQPADGREECEKMWGLRREFSYSLRDTGRVSS